MCIIASSLSNNFYFRSHSSLLINLKIEVNLFKKFFVISKCFCNFWEILIPIKSVGGGFDL